MCRPPDTGNVGYCTVGPSERGNVRYLTLAFPIMPLRLPSVSLTDVIEGNRGNTVRQNQTVGELVHFQAQPNAHRAAKLFAIITIIPC